MSERLADLELAFQVLARMVHEEYEQNWPLSKIAMVWDNGLTALEEQALQRLDASDTYLARRVATPNIPADEVKQ